MKRSVLFAAFVGCVVAANWALNRYGIIELPVVGMMAPAGVYFAGLSFGVRDALHEAGGRSWVVTAILTGAAVSYVLEDAVILPGGVVALAVASGAAFLVSETLDFAVYAPLRDRNWPAAVVASNVVGAVADSALFLWLAFGSLNHMEGQVVGKLAMVAPALLIVWGVRRAVLPRHSPTFVAQAG